MPTTCGDSLVHLSEIDHLVEASEPIYELPVTSPTGLERKLAENVAALVEDEATIQIGYGAVSECIAPFLVEKRDLGMHTEMFPESALTLIEHGALNCARKTLYRGKIVCSFAAGTKRLYDWLNENSMIEMKPFDYVNDSRIIAMNHKMTAINTALQVDLFGNVYSDMLGFEEYSGAGGQPDFVLGASMCPSGKSIIALPSTAAQGRASRIVAHPTLAANAKAPLIPTVSRFHADHVVTEWGAASLKGKTANERARALIEIADPDFRDGLRQEGARTGLIG
jgi:4-hydroxybutyrate CoA-transferase